MHILYLTDAIPPWSSGGSGKRIWSLCAELARQGSRVTVVATVESKKDVGVTTRDGVNITLLYSKYHRGLRAYMSVYNPWLISKIKKIITAERPDIVHADNIHAHISYAVLKTAKRMGARTLITLRDAMSIAYGKIYPKTPVCGAVVAKRSWADNIRQARKRFNPFRNILIRRYIRFADVSIAVSGALRKILEVNRVRVDEVLHDGVEDHPLDLSDKDKKEVLHTYGLENSRIIFLPGRLDYAKGVFTAIESLRGVLSAVPRARLVFAGVSGDERKKFTAYARELGVYDHVTMAPWIDGRELAALYACADVVISPSLCFDMFPGVNLEAALYKKPAISGCFGGAQEFITHGKTGLIINPYHGDELSTAIVRVLTHEDEAHAWGRAAYERVRGEFSISKETEKLVSIYRRLTAV